VIDGVSGSGWRRRKEERRLAKEAAAWC